MGGQSRGSQGGSCTGHLESPETTYPKDAKGYFIAFLTYFLKDQKNDFQTSVQIRTLQITERRKGGGGAGGEGGGGEEGRKGGEARTIFLFLSIARNTSSICDECG